MSKFAVVEKQFEYKGHDCILIFTMLGERIGCVSINDDKKYHDTYDIIKFVNFARHHWVLFAGRLLPEYNPKKDYYVGFDCFGRDYDKAKEYGLIDEKRYKQFVKTSRRSPTILQPVKSLEYVETECKKIVDQLEEENETI